jgi:DNA-directed RNA polymerase specialized sigma24 family protein
LPDDEGAVPDAGSVTHLLQQFKAGDEAALGQLLKRYWPFLLARAGEHLPVAYRRSADEEDVALEVACLLQRGVEHGQWRQLANRQDLVALLNKITARRAINQLKYETAAVRGGRQVPESLSTGGDSGPGPGVAERRPEPADEVLGEEWCRHYLSRLGDGLRPVAELLAAGHSREDIAAALCCSQRTVTRKISLIRAKWLELVAEGEQRGPAPAG